MSIIRDYLKLAELFVHLPMKYIENAGKKVNNVKVT